MQSTPLLSEKDEIQARDLLKTRIQNSAEYILRCQKSDGAILWYPDGKLDPWDHTEAAMGLTIAGYHEQAKKALLWLEKKQLPDGTWQAQYFEDETLNNNPKDKNKVETNFVAYIATGVWHFYSVTQDLDFVKRIFPAIKKAISFVLDLQNPEGDIQWAISSCEELLNDALVTACSSILRSLECAIQLARILDQETKAWESAYQKLFEALKTKPWRFDRTWESKERFSMDWFYPVLAGIYTQEEIQLRLQHRWQEFIKPELGCRCVSDQPWVTVAESCELSLAMVAAGKKDIAQTIHTWLTQWQDNDGGFWTGYHFENNVIWPQEKTSWTAAAFILAADAIYELTPAHNLFTQPSQF